MERRSRDTLPALRRNVTWKIADIIFRRICLHIDAWLYELSDNNIIYVIQTSAGGRNIISTNALLCMADGSSHIIKTPDISKATPRHLNHAWSRGKPWLNTIHWRDIQPGLRKPRVGYVFPYSIALHYVWSDPSIAAPTEGTENHWGATKRGQNYLNSKPYDPRDYHLHVRKNVYGPSKAQRAIMRTLDKLLK